MSNVKIQGNASGTGTLTISSPNTNTDRSLTLPDTAGEILTKDSSGNVEIGTLTTTGGNGGQAIVVENGGDIQFKAANNTDFVHIFCDVNDELRCDGYFYPYDGVRGGMLQVAQAAKKNTQSHSGTGYVDISGLSVTLTPRATTSKILIMWNVTMGQSLQHHQSTGRLIRQIGGGAWANDFLVGDADGSRGRHTFATQDGAQVHGNMDQYGGSIVDSPSTTSAITYKLQYSGEGGTTWINRGNEADGNNYISPRAMSSLIAIEIGG